MKAFPFAIWPGELIKAGPPDQSPYHRSRLLDPVQSYSVQRATQVIDPERPSFQRAKYIPAETLNSMEWYQHPGEKASNIAGATVGAHPTTSVYGTDRTDGFLPAGHAHRNADIKGRIHFLASADHDAAFHELSDLHRAIAATGSLSEDHIQMLEGARRRLEEAEMRLSHARSGHASALAEPMMGMADTHHKQNGNDRGKVAQDILLRQQNALSPDVTQFPAISFGLPADSMTGRPAKSASEMAKQLSLQGSTPFIAAYLAGNNSGFLPQENLQHRLREVRSQDIPTTPQDIYERYRTLEKSRRNNTSVGLGSSRGSELASHVADGTSTWGDYSGNALYGRAFRPQAPEWARQSTGDALGRAATLHRLLGEFSNVPGAASISRTYADLPQQQAPKPPPPQAGVMGSITRTYKDLPPPR